MVMSEIIFTVQNDEDGGYVAESKLSTGSIITQGDSLPELKVMIKDAIEGYFFDKPNLKPKSVHIHFEETFALA